MRPDSDSFPFTLWSDQLDPLHLVCGLSSTGEIDPGLMR